VSDPSAGSGHDGLEIFDIPADADVEAPDAEASDANALDPNAPEAEALQRRSSRPRWPGAISAALAILMVITWAVALACALGGMLDLGVGLSYSSILLSGIALLAGIVAVAGNWGRGWGSAAIAISVLLNPLVLLYVLGWIGAL
jgi:hypothetical protein